MNWKGKRVLVTGAGGFIGSHLTERLVDLGADVHALVHYNAMGTWGWLDASSSQDEIRVFAGDIRDRDSIHRALAGCEVVFHLAALVGIPYSYDAPSSYVHTNVEGTLNVLHAARESGVEVVIHTSTSEAYGTARYVPIDERHPLQGQSPYSASKIGADKMAEAYHASFQLPVVIVRPFNTFGPRQSARAVIPTIIMQLLSGKAVRLGSVSPTRDLNFVTNTVEGMVLAAEVPEAIGRTVNLGSGEEISILGLAELLAQLMGKRLTLEREDERVRPAASEVERLVADARLAQELLGWKPRVGLEEGLSRTIEWMALHPGRYRPDVYAV